MPRTPSLSQQIADTLGTKDKKLQLERITTLMDVGTAPVVSINVLFARRNVYVDVNSPERLTAIDVKNILNAAVDKITEQVVKAEIEQELAEPIPPEPVEGEELVGMEDQEKAP